MTTWDTLRATPPDPSLIALVSQADFLADQPATISHLRSAHYAVFRVETATHTYVARLGRLSQQIFTPHNTGLLGCATAIDHDQSYEWETGQHLHAHGAQIIRPLSYQRLPLHDIDILWLPFIAAADNTPTTQQWVDVLHSFQQVPRLDSMPVFSNYQKTARRIAELSTDSAHLLREYETAMSTLLSVATRWSVVHGDLHAENAIVTSEAILAYDLDTVSWAPAAWDVTHLALRHGTGSNLGYDPEQLRDLLGFSQAEYAAALELRSIASRVARLSAAAK